MRRLDWAREAPRWPDAEAARIVSAGGVEWRVVRSPAAPDGAPAVLLLHGAGASAHSWHGVFARLSADHDVIAPDLPGHGFSSLGPGGVQSLPAMATAVAALLEALEARPAVIAGHSAGAAVALRLALDAAAPPYAVYAINGALAPFRGIAGALFPPMARLLAANPVTPRAFALAATGDKGTGRRLIRGTGSELPPEGYARYQKLFETASHVNGALRMMAQWDLGPLLADLPRLRCRLVLSVGARDRAVPPAEAERLARSLPFAEIERHPDLGHVMHEERPERFAARIAALAAEAAARARPARL